MIKSKSIKKLVLTAVSALALTTTSVGLSQVINQPQEVQASTAQLKAARQKLLDAGWLNGVMDTNAKPKIHYYKKAKIKTTWNNTNMRISANPGYTSTNAGGDVVVGYVTVGKTKYYLIYEPDSDPDFVTKDAFEKPTLMHSTHMLHIYQVYVDTDEDDIRAQEATYDNNGAPYIRNFMIPTHHNVLNNVKCYDGKTRDLVPVYGIAQKHAEVKDAFEYAITKSDYDQLKKGPTTKKKLTLQGKGKIYQKNGHVESTYKNSKFLKSVKKDANKMLKSKKLKKEFTNATKDFVKTQQSFFKENIIG